MITLKPEAYVLLPMVLVGLVFLFIGVFFMFGISEVCLFTGGMFLFFAICLWVEIEEVGKC